ncbi:protein PUTATIVE RECOMBINATION INITIATION DEFECT 1 isoform X1 [Zingiber officinale]|uniref:protein PUTATIVE RECOMBINATION INITIATION DEFECT 1 isoform X1 n=1 Tax=Zingiber officinale TaxID=94328 RepID=UPI001C4CA2C3|nr:protein PUTATIVE RECOMBINATION INITIATION DEFECT 1 isoform X1 [Zingiber officinale]
MRRDGVVFQEEGGEGWQMELFDEDADEDREMAGCGKGHRPSMSVATSEGGVICLACLSALLSDPRALTHHVSYALSQLSTAIRCPDFVRRLAGRQPHLIVSPLVRALASFDDEPLARQLIDLVSDLSECGLPRSVFGDFVSRVSDFISSGGLAWSRRQFFMLHCLGVLLNSRQDCNPAAHIRDKAALFSILVTGLQLPSEEIRGEILFVLYKMFLQQVMPWTDESNSEHDYSLKEESLLKLALETLLKAQKDDVRTNCIALLLVLAQRGVFENLFGNSRLLSLNSERVKPMKEDGLLLSSSLVDMFADAIKGPLLSSDIQLQTNTLDLIFHTVSSGFSSVKQIQALIEKDIADYVFEVLRLSGNQDSVIISCLHILDILATADEAFVHRLAVGFNILLPVLRYVIEIPLHPAQNHALKLVWTCITHCPGIMSISQVEELAGILAQLFKRKATVELPIVSEAFTLACLTFVELLKSPSSCNINQLAPLIQEASRNAIISSISSQEDSVIFLYSLYLVKELYSSIVEECSITCAKQELEKQITETCEKYLLPWLARVIDEMQDEEIVLGILETFHLILLKGSEIVARCFAEFLVSSSWFSLAFGCLGFFPTAKMKTRIYMMLSSVIDLLLGPDLGEPIRDCYLNLPCDPLELIYLLGQSNLQDSFLASCQSAVLMLLYVSSLYDDRLTDGSQLLASLEQYILVNYNNLSSGATHPMIGSQLVHLYALVRSDTLNYKIPYSAEVEKSIFNLIAQMNWDLLSIDLHPRALKWLFQQEEISTPLSFLILNVCRSYSTNKDQICLRANSIKLLDIQMIAELIVSGDNFVIQLMLSLLVEGLEEDRKNDIVHLITAMTDILNIFPRASNEFILHGIAETLRKVFYSVYFNQIETCSLLIFNVLYLADHAALCQDEDWRGIILKLLEHLKAKLTSSTFGQEEILIIAIFSLILHYSTRQILVEASKAILLDKSLALALERIVHTSCGKGPTLVSCDEDTPAGETLIFVLLLYFFTLRSSHIIFSGAMNWQEFFQSSDEVHGSSVFCIKCHDICRLLHFGPTVVKLVSSHCLMELLTRISDQRGKSNNNLKLSMKYLESIMTVTEGLLFYEDFSTATACRVCLSRLLGWEKLGVLEKKVIRNSRWFRIIMEELAMALAAPSLASRSFINQHKPAAHVAIILLQLNESPPWLNSVFSSSCISGILGNLSACNLTPDMVKLFKELTIRKYMNKEQVDTIHHLFQVCRKQVYTDSFGEQTPKEDLPKAIKNHDDMGDICNVLIQLMLSSNKYCNESKPEHEKLLEEIDMFFQISTTVME